MSRRLKSTAAFVALLAVAGCAGQGPALPGGAGQSAASRPLHRRGMPAAACPGSRQNRARCDVLVRTDIAPQNAPQGLTPAQLQSAYKLTKYSSSRGAGQIVAIVDAYDNPDVASDLATYRSAFGLPTAKFTKYNQFGQQKNYPEGNFGWGIEIDLDAEMVSASCPNCTIDLIEADSDTWSDMQTAEKEAVKLGAHIVTNSYTGSGASQSDYDKRDVTYLASAGDTGYGLYDPADFTSVVAVGGTELTQDGGKRGWTEVVWSSTNGNPYVSTGGGCSTRLKPSWQHDPGCVHRTGNDVSAIADPDSGVAEYDSYAYAYYGWIVSGGTSVSTPFVAGIFALAGDASKQDGGKRFWDNKSRGLYKITSGSDGTCSPTYLCTAGTNEYGSYSGPAGWGTPDGIAAF